MSVKPIGDAVENEIFFTCKVDNIWRHIQRNQINKLCRLSVLWREGKAFSMIVRFLLANKFRAKLL